MAFQASQPAKKSEFDIGRERVRTQAQREKERTQEALKRRLAASGTGSGGFAEEQRRLTARDLRRETGSRLADIQQTEFATQRQEAELQKQRQFQTGERLGSESFGREQAGLGRTFAGEQAQFGRQFQLAQLGRQQQFGAQQAGLGRQFQTGERTGSEAFAGQQAQLGRQQSITQLGLQAGIQQELLGQQQTFESEQALRDRQQQITLAGISAGVQQELATLGAQLEGGLLTTQAAIANQTRIDELNTQAAFSAGATGGTRPTDPVLAAAYDAGANGQTLADAQNAVQDRRSFMNALILSLETDPEKNPGFATQLNNIAETFNISTPDFGGVQLAPTPPAPTPIQQFITLTKPGIGRFGGVQTRVVEAGSQEEADARSSGFS